MIEALTDPKTWLFALFSALDNVPNSLTNQRQIIVSSFGFSPLQTTLLGCVDGVIEIVTIWTGVTLAAHLRDARAYVGAVYFIPNLLGAILVITLPWSNKVGLLFSVWITGRSPCLPPEYYGAYIFRRCRYNWLRARPILDFERDSRAYEESNYKRNPAVRLLHRKRGWPVHVAGTIQTSVSLLALLEPR